MSLQDKKTRTIVCIITGCDYLKNIKGIGFKTVLKIFSSENPKQQLKNFLSKKNLSGLSVDQYLKNVEQTTFAFFHPLVYSAADELLYLNLPDKMTVEETKLLNFFVGQKFDDFKKFCKGKLDIKTMKEREAVCVDFKRITQFIDYVPDNSCGRLNNLCTTLITFDNFDKIDPSFNSHETKSETSDLQDSHPKKRIKRTTNHLKEMI